MELGLLIAPQRKLEPVVDIVRRFVADISPSHIWVCDRLLDNYTNLSDLLPDFPVSPPAEFLDPLLTIAAMADLEPSQPEFGIAVTDFVRRAPPDLARACHTMAQIAGKPLNIGFGSGEAVNLKPLGYGHRATPVTFLEHELRRFAEINQSGICRSGAKSVDLGYNASPAKIWVGGQRARMLGLTARYADGWLPAWKMSPSEYKDKKDTLERLAAEYDRPCPKPGMFVGVMMGESKQSVLRQIESSPLYKLWALEMPAEIWRRWGIIHPGGDDVKGTPDVIVSELPIERLRGLASSIPVEMFAEASFLGNAGELLKELWEYRKAGMEHVTLMSNLQIDSEGNIDLGDSYAEFRQLCEELKRW